MDCICSKHAVQAIQRQANASTIFLVDTLKRQFLYKNTINFDVDIFFPRLSLNQFHVFFVCHVA